MNYLCTRDRKKKVSGMEAIIQGISEDGGLYVPEYFPALPKLQSLMDLSYEELALKILKLYFEEYTEEELKKAVSSAYGEKFHGKHPVEVVKKGEVHFLELFHGPTLAFKDMALTLLPHLLKTALQKKGIQEEVVILTATSGDTGKAALEGFRDVEGIQVVVFYPKTGVSDMQRLQMVTQEGRNTHVLALEGNFDDAQNGVKKIFGDEDFRKELKEKGYVLSSANSINIGRLIPQIVYYVYGYLRMVESGDLRMEEKMNIAVPTGNFGNILAAFYAKNMGLPMEKLLCASNDNNILTEFFLHGTYDTRRNLFLTSSPSMDILVSSNLERFLHEVSGKDEDLVKRHMDSLKAEGLFQWNGALPGDFYAEYADEKDVSQCIEKVYKEERYLMDPHTAVAYSVSEKYRKTTGDLKPLLLASTASPFKFPHKVLTSLGAPVSEDLFENIEALAMLLDGEVPTEISDLKIKPILHKRVTSLDAMAEVLLDALSGGEMND
ncbi:threonine synthase [Proteiniclasticum ruminis]|nr:threonine synthase [Proteiniclasticum ruminis]